MKGHGATYTNAKAGTARGAASPDFDETSMGRKEAFAPGPLVVDLPPGDKRSVSVVVEAAPGRPGSASGRR